MTVAVPAPQCVNRQVLFRLELWETDRLLVCRQLEINACKELHKYDPSSYVNNDSPQKHLKRNFGTSYPFAIETNDILRVLISRFMALARQKQDIADSRISKAVGYIRKTSIMRYRSKPIQLQPPIQSGNRKNLGRIQEYIERIYRIDSKEII